MGSVTPQATRSNHFRYVVTGGEFVVQGSDDEWTIAFNGIRIGGLHPCADDAVAAIDRARRSELPGPNLEGVPDPPKDLTAWHASLADEARRVAC